MPILHTVYFRLRDDDALEAKIPECVSLFNELKGIKASVVKGVYQASVCGLAAPAGAVFTHVALLVADSHEALYAYLHGDAHLKVWIPLIKPHLEDIVVFDNDLATPFTGIAGSHALSLLLKLSPQNAEQEAETTSAAMQFPLAIAGLSSVHFAPHGGGGLDKAALIEKLEWPDKAQGAQTIARARTPRMRSRLSPPRWHAPPPPTCGTCTCTCTCTCAHAHAHVHVHVARAHMCMYAALVSRDPCNYPGFTHCLSVVATDASGLERLLGSTELQAWLTGLAPPGYAAMVARLASAYCAI